MEGNDVSMAAAVGVEGGERKEAGEEEEQDGGGASTERPKIQEL